MNYTERLYRLIERRDGIVLTKDVVEEGIPRVYISKLIKNGTLERLDRGIYITKDCFDDEMYRLQAKYNLAIFSHESALFLHDLTDRDPIQYTITLPAGYNSQNIKSFGVKVFSIKKELYDVGLTVNKTMFGRDVLCYDMERTFCDIVRSRSQLDIAILIDAIKRYSKRRNKNLPLLMRYAEKLETIISRGITNTRMRDFYDCYILNKLQVKNINQETLEKALNKTAENRGTLELLEEK